VHIVTQLECFVLGEEAYRLLFINAFAVRIDHFVGHVIEELAVTAA